MTNDQQRARRVAVIGGGISGLATAHRLHELDSNLSITLLERGKRLGGVLDTVHQDGFLFEWGADNFITTVPWALDLCRRIGFEDQLEQTRPNHRGAFVVRKGRLHKIPQGFIIMAPSRVWPVVSTPILGPWGKLRMALEYFVPARKEEGDESLAGFVIRRFGRQTYDRLVQPLIGGIYTGDPMQLSLESTMPRFKEMERSHGSLIRAVLKQARQKGADKNSSGGRYSMFVAPRRGISSLLEALERRLPSDSVQLNRAIESLRPTEDGRWQVRSAGQSEETYDAVVVATQAKAAAELLRPTDATLAEQLAGIHHSGCCIVSLAYRRDQIAHAMDGFGFVVPLAERRKIISGSFSSVKYPGRAPDDCVLIRVFIGGACQPELLELDDDSLRGVAVEELAELMGIEGSPLLSRIARLPETMPQYYVGHRQRVERIKGLAAKHPGLFVTGNAHHGVGIPFCVHSGEATAGRVVEFLKPSERPAVENTPEA